MNVRRGNPSQVARSGEAKVNIIEVLIVVIGTIDFVLLINWILLPDLGG